MHISRVQGQIFTNTSQIINNNNPENRNIKQATNNIQNNTIPAGFRYNANIHFGEFFDPNRKVPHIDYEEYMAMIPATKTRFRKMYREFSKKWNTDELYDKKTTYIPLQSEKLMDDFLEASKKYVKYKDQPIICLGRSPKWFLNAALWMENGINDYKFVAFSKYWFRPDKREGILPIEGKGPTEKEIKAYRKYLKEIKADPKTIVDHMEKTGQKTVITDYIYTGKGATSFLDVMANFADDLGILEKFAKSIEIVGIGSTEYMAHKMKVDEVSEPEVFMPPKLREYRNNIKQTFHNMPQIMFEEMLINENTNECRSTFYPHEAWTVYRPDRFKTGQIKDMKTAKKMIKNSNERFISYFTPVMFDYRNLLSFRIMDAMKERGILKAIHKSKF